MRPIAYRGDLDGIRAIAVVAVLLFHYQLDFAGGGFIGVDVFFVLSGFLMTAILWPQARAPYRASKLLRTVCHRHRCSGDWHAAAGQYVRGPAPGGGIVRREFRVLVGEHVLRERMHTGRCCTTGRWRWRSSITWASLLLWMTRRSRIALAVVFFCSALACALVTAVSPKTAFFWMPFRLSGFFSLLRHLSFLAYLTIADGRLTGLGRSVRNVLVGAALLSLALCVTLYTAVTPFPGLAVLIPVIATGGLIVFGGGTATSRLYDNPVCRHIGRISYSIYLWHFVVMSFALNLLGTPLRLPVLAAMTVLIYLLSELSYRYIEQPFAASATRPALARSPLHSLGLSAFSRQRTPIVGLVSATRPMSAPSIPPCRIVRRIDAASSNGCWRRCHQSACCMMPAKAPQGFCYGATAMPMH